MATTEPSKLLRKIEHIRVLDDESSVFVVTFA